MLELKSDYFSLVFVFNDEFLNSDIDINTPMGEDKYFNLFSDIAKEIDKSLYLSLFFGDLESSYKGGKGYDSKYQFGYDGATISYSSIRPDMGILFQMSGSVLNSYRALYFEKFNEFIEVNQMLRILDSLFDKKIGFFRLSRLDVAVDFIDEDVNLTGLYSDLKNENIKIYNYKGNLNTSEFKSYERRSETETIYIGSRQSDNMLRIYDKKIQVIEHNISTDLEKALKATEWVRFEMEIKRKAAHLLTDVLLDIETFEEYQSYLVQLITSKYRFGNKIDGKMEFISITERMFSAIKHKGVNIEIPRVNRDFDLHKSEMYFETGYSGLQSLIYKQRLLYGKEYVEKWFEDILKFNEEEYRPSEETSRYIKKIKDEQVRKFGE